MCDYVRVINFRIIVTTDLTRVCGLLPAGRPDTHADVPHKHADIVTTQTDIAFLTAINL